MPGPEKNPDEEESLDETEALAHGDVDALLALARSRRAAKDMKGCYEAYRSAAELGSVEASYAVALFLMNGSVVPQDLKEGTMHLRSAAEKGSVAAKVYLGNLYELGIHYKADPEKADVWYRNAARTAGVVEEPGTPEHARALAELGCARYALALVESGDVDDEADKARLLSRAKAHGYGLKPKDLADTSGDRATFTDALLAAEHGPDSGRGAESRGAGVPRERKDTAPETKAAREKAELASKERSADTIPPKPKPKLRGAGPSNVSDALAAFGYALLFATAGIGAAYAATLGARELVSRGTVLPVLGTRADAVFPIVLGVVGVLPAWLVYRFSAFAKALVAGAMLGGVGWVAWGMGQAIDESRPLQGIAFGLAGFLGALLVLGIMGGTKTHRVGSKRR